MLQGADHHHRARTAFLVLIASAFAVLTVAAIGAQSAPAQALGSEFCQEYPNAPGCQDTGPTDNEGGADPGDDATPSAAGPSADEGSTGGSLPFTGYPLTALILLLLILLLVGLALRAYLAVRDRVAGDRPAGH
jgi:hypothetical protein